MFEMLENRRMLAVTASLSTTGVLTVTGTTGNDNVYASHQVAGNLLRISDGSATPKTFNMALVKKIVAVGREGNDQLWFDSNLGAIPTSIDGGAGDDYLVSPAGNDTLTGGAGNDNMGAGNGNDKLDAGDGNDTVNGGNGNDTINAGAGNDRVSGGGNNDLLDGGLGADDLNGDAGTDTVTYASRTAAVVVDITENPTELADDGQAGEKDFVRASVENLVGGSGNDKLTGAVHTLTTPGLTRNNKLIGGAGNDTLTGLDGNDTLDGGLGTDQLIGGDGADTADYTGRADALVITLDGLANDGKAGENDKIDATVENATGGNGADKITGNSANNVLRGGGGNDSVYGAAGNDTLYGDGGIDKLFGDAGDDTFYVRKPASSLLADNDTLDGGAGADKAQVDATDTKTSIETLLS